MKVVEILLSKTFANYQKIILTHERGLFEELRRHIGSNHHDWQFAKLAGNAKDNPTLDIVKTELEVAEDFLANDQLAECGNRLRKCAETMLENFLRLARNKKSHGQVLDHGKFASLHQLISEAKSILVLNAQKEFADLLQGQYSQEEFEQMVSEEKIDHRKITEADKDKKSKIVAKLIGGRANLQQAMLELLTDAARKQFNAVKLLDEVKKMKDRILNPASHAGVTPLYSKEAEDAIKTIAALQQALDIALKTL